jgi:hypothetical protein
LQLRPAGRQLHLRPGFSCKTESAQAIFEERSYERETYDVASQADAFANPMSDTTVTEAGRKSTLQQPKCGANQKNA